MSLLLDQQYAGMLAPYVRNFHKKGHNKWNFSCPFCGDSKVIKTRARGFLLPAGDHLTYYCHNCNISKQSLQTVLKHVDSNLYRQYLVDKFKEQGKGPPEKSPLSTFKRPDYIRRIDRNLTKVSALSSDHPVREYLYERQIPTSVHHRLYWTPTFKSWSNSIEPGTFGDTTYDEGRLVIPLVDDRQNVLGYQGRALVDRKGGLKYVTILLNEDNPKIYGLDEYDRNKLGHAFEGPIDAMFVENSVAAAGGRIDSVLKQVGISRDRTIIVYDNEPRSIFTIKKMEKAVNEGWTLCIWPEEVKEKDVNAMVLGGRTPSEVTKLIDNNRYSGLLAKAKIAQWRKV
jgi:transcription elongation factor Elf1